MPSDRDTFLHSICAAPDDDTPRLVFADWLDDHGESTRAKFIREQCELEHVEEFGPRWRELKTRCDRLVLDRHKTWSKALEGRGVLNVEFRRGFVDEVTIYAKRFLAEYELLFSSAPIRRVKFSNLHAASGSVPLSELLASPGVARLRGIDFSTSHLNDREAKAITESPQLRALNELTLHAHEMTYVPALALMQSPHLSSLTRLKVWGGEGDHFISGLVSDPGFRRIERLEISGSSFGPSGAWAIASSPHSGGLKLLRVSSSIGSYPRRVGPTGLKHLAASPTLSGLQTLIMTSQKIGLGGVKALAGASQLRALRHLNLSGNPFTRAMLDALIPSDTLKSLISLDLSRCGVTKSQVASLKSAFPETYIIAEE